MASGKKELEAFNMLKFMYQDDDDDMEDADRGEDEGSQDEVELDLEQQESKVTDDVFPGMPLQQLDTSNLTPYPSVRVENSDSDTLKDASKESEMEDLTGANIPEDAYTLNIFLPPPPKAKCPEDLQDKINKFLAYKRQRKSFNAEVRNRKDYRNPDFLLHAVRYQDIDQIGSCFSIDVFDPHGYDENDYYDAIEVDMKLEMERKEKERKSSPKVEFVSGGTQQAVLAAAKSAMSVSGVPNLSSGGVQLSSVSADTLSRECQRNKKSKWDMVDGDQRTALGGGQVAQDHASLLSAAKSGSGYAMFVQQKRREAEERRSSERKVDRRS